MNWIKITDSIPKLGLEVLILEKYRDIKTIKIGHRCDIDPYSREEDIWVDDHNFPIDKATYWMPLPELPSA